MKPIEPLPLYHSWPLLEREQRFGQGMILDPPSHGGGTVRAADPEALASRGIGLWQCDLSDDSLTWSPAVYDIFGLPRGAHVSRKDAVALYADDSAAAMERLRAYAIKHRRGFTLDAEIRPATGPARWMRLIAAPICADHRTVGLHGVKVRL